MASALCFIDIYNDGTRQWQRYLTTTNESLLYDTLDKLDSEGIDNVFSRETEADFKESIIHATKYLNENVTRGYDTLLMQQSVNVIQNAATKLDIVNEPDPTKQEALIRKHWINPHNPTE